MFSYSADEAPNTWLIRRYGAPLGKTEFSPANNEWRIWWEGRPYDFGAQGDAAVALHALSDERAYYRKKLADLGEVLGAFVGDNLDTLIPEARARVEEIAKLRAALAFYADDANYVNDSPMVYESSKVEAEGGDIAKAALGGEVKPYDARWIPPDGEAL